MGKSSDRPIRSQMRGAMQFLRRLFSAAMTWLCDATMLVQRSHPPGSQLLQGLPVLDDVRGRQVAVIGSASLAVGGGVIH